MSLSLIKKLKPKSPDVSIGKSVGDNELARLAHINNIVDQINSAFDASASTTLPVTFDKPKVYFTPTSPATGNITSSETDGRIGVIQKIYHNAGSAPSFPASWVLLGTTTYATSQLNIIYAEWVNSGRVEYWITQEN